MSSMIRSFLFTKHFHVTLSETLLYFRYLTYTFLTNLLKLTNHSMTKKDVVTKVKKLQLPKGSYIVYGASPLAIYGLRDVRDIDMFVSVKVYKKVDDKG